MHEKHAVATWNLGTISAFADDRKSQDNCVETGGPLKFHLNNTETLGSHNNYNRLMMFRKVIVAYCENRTKRTHEFCGQNVQFLEAAAGSKLYFKVLFMVVKSGV
jgi:hypothetical protein